MRFKFIAFLGLFACAQGAFAADLVEVYADAAQHDPILQQAKANWMAAREDVPIYLSKLMPQIDIVASASRGFARTKLAGESTYVGHTDNTHSFGISLKQALFDQTSYRVMKQSKINAQVAHAQYAASLQQLMLRTATAYFGVLQAQRDYQYAFQEERAIDSQLQQVLKRAAVGMATPAMVEGSKAAYDEAVSAKISARYAVDNAKETLAQITGKRYQNIRGVSDWLPLVAPKPTHVADWVKRSEQENYVLHAAVLTAQATKLGIDIASSARSPRLSGTVNVGVNASAAPFGTSGAQNVQHATTIGVNLDIPLFQGGSVSARVRKASHQYEAALSAQEAVHREVVSAARSSYLGVLSMVSSAKAYKQAIVSSQAALKANLAGFMAGTETIVHVLNSQSTLYEMYQAYAHARYQYLLNTLSLKDAAGMLSPSDLRDINHFLTKKVHLCAVDDILSKCAVDDILSKPAHQLHRKAVVVKHFSGKKPKLYVQKVMKHKSGKHVVHRLKVPHPKPQASVGRDPEVVQAERAIGYVSGVR